MRSSPAHILLSCVLLLLAVTTVQANIFNETAEYGALPACAQGCVDTATSNTECTSDLTTCFCSNANVTAQFNICLGTSCTLPGDILAAQRYQADECHYPIRSRQPLHRGVLWSTFILASIFVALRLLSRAPVLQGTGFSWDDDVIIFSYALAIAIVVATEITIHNGSGLDEYRLSVRQIELYMLWTYISEVLYIAVIVTTKISVMLLYLRMWTTVKMTRTLKITSWLIILMLVMYGIACGTSLAFQCAPVHFIWTNIYGGAPGTCLSIAAIALASGAISICFDIIVFFLPMPSLLRLNIPWQKKVGVSAVFLVGFAVTVCSSFRLQYLTQFDSRANSTWVFQRISMWSIIEGNLSIVCCCMPAAVGLFQRMWKSWKGSRDSMQYITEQSRSDGFDPKEWSDAQLVDLEHAPAPGEKHGRTMIEVERLRQASQAQSTNSGPPVGQEEHQYGTQPGPYPGGRGHGVDGTKTRPGRDLTGFNVKKSSEVPRSPRAT